MRSPPGAWRLFAPALLVWAVAALAIGHPGTGPVITLAAGGIGVLMLVLAATGRRLAGRISRIGRAGLGYGAVCCAAMVLLGVGIEVGERARADPRLAAAAENGAVVDIDVVLRGFPHTRPAGSAGPVGPVGSAGSAEASGWVSAGARASGGEVPVVLWLQGASPGDRERWAPGMGLAVHGVPVSLGPSSPAAYGIRVRDVSPAPAMNGPARAVEAAGRAAAEFRNGLREAAAAVPGAALVPGLTVGDTSLVDESLESRMQHTSLTHLVAVSGANCALVTGAVVWCAALLGAGRRVRIVVAGAALVGFVFVVGPDASVQRAALMASVVLVSGFGGKQAVALPALGAAMLVMLLSNPWQALQPGFALSVAATAGILLLVPGLERGLRRLVPIPRWIVLPIAVALSAQLACGPLLLLLQPGIPAVGVLANVIAGPAAPLGTGLGLLALLLLPWWPTAGAAAVLLASLPARWIAATAEVAEGLPFARWPWPAGWSGALLLAAIEGVVLLAWALATRRLALPEDRKSGRRPWLQRRRLSVRARALVAVLLCASAGTFAGPVLVAPAIERVGVPHDWFVVACDVGQGDAILLRDPARPGAVMLVDTGDEPALLRACLDRFGVSRIALLVLTHDDRDHVGALNEVIGDTEAALVAPHNREDGASRPLLARLSTAGVPHRVGAAGQSGGDGFAWEVLAPRPDRIPDDTNAASLVLRVRAGESTVLLLADTGAEEQQALRASGAELRAAVVKVAHHGSRDQDPALADTVGAELALVSVGAGNGYGHPVAETLDAFTRAGARPLRTDTHGSIAVSGEPGSLRVWAERAAPAPPAAARR